MCRLKDCTGVREGGSRRYRLSVAISLASILLLSGCSRGDRPELGYVSGKITMDGAPLGNVMIRMKPDVGREAAAIADDQGNYTIQYLHGVPGTKVGRNTVTFEWPLGYEGPTKPIPRKYQSMDSPFVIDVKPGRNKFDFNLESDPNETRGNLPRSE
ncbi:MAG: hypothetical protein KatS3mg114_1155 [Planctomycetaceae bacterium]|nr:MAG: hypothetical protein KatS3mg114_1155 [Planctomycetaceae bacterium]